MSKAGHTEAKQMFCMSLSHKKDSAHCTGDVVNRPQYSCGGNDSTRTLCGEMFPGYSLNPSRTSKPFIKEPGDDWRVGNQPNKPLSPPALKSWFLHG